MKSILEQYKTQSVLTKQTKMQNNSVISKRSLAVSLGLTPLVDAFAILVIYLLVNTSAAEKQIDIDAQISLPIAQNSEILKDGIILKIQNGRYYINDSVVNTSDLAKKLEEVVSKEDKDEVKLVVQADKKEDFTKISPIMIASSYAGIEKIQFVVLKGMN